MSPISLQDQMKREEVIFDMMNTSAQELKEYPAKPGSDEPSHGKQPRHKKIHFSFLPDFLCTPNLKEALACTVSGCKLD